VDQIPANTQLSIGKILALGPANNAESHVHQTTSHLLEIMLDPNIVLQDSLVHWTE
jgi:hypothetical protein